MKIKTILAILLFSAAAASAAPWFVYSNPDGVKKGEWNFQPGTSDGILVSASEALKKADQYVLGDWEGGLFKSALSRLDNEVNAALLKPGDPVTDQDLLAAHKTRADRLRGFLPAPEPAPLEAALKSDAMPEPVSSSLYELLINGARYEGEPFVLPLKYEESEFRMEIINRSTATVWRVDVEMEAEPNISFWKKGRNKGLNSVPRRLFIYNYQAMFKPLKEGGVFGIPIEVFYIKENNYELTVRLESKIGKEEFVIPVVFQEEEKTN